MHNKGSLSRQECSKYIQQNFVCLSISWAGISNPNPIMQLKCGHYARGVPAFETISGTFAAPWSGVYSFTALVNFQTNHSSCIGGSSVSASICVMKDCEGKAYVLFLLVVISNYVKNIYLSCPVQSSSVPSTCDQPELWHCGHRKFGGRGESIQWHMFITEEEVYFITTCCIHSVIRRCPYSSKTPVRFHSPFKKPLHLWGTSWETKASA